MFGEKENLKNCKFGKIFRKFLLLVWSTNKTKQKCD